ncbi:unnamed protein product [Ixodes pacificus]
MTSSDLVRRAAARGVTNMAASWRRCSLSANPGVVCNRSARLENRADGRRDRYTTYCQHRLEKHLRLL